MKNNMFLVIACLSIPFFLECKNRKIKSKHSALFEIEKTVSESKSVNGSVETIVKTSKKASFLGFTKLKNKKYSSLKITGGCSLNKCVVENLTIIGGSTINKCEIETGSITGGTTFNGGKITKQLNIIGGNSINSFEAAGDIIIVGVTDINDSKFFKSVSITGATEIEKSNFTDQLNVTGSLNILESNMKNIRCSDDLKLKKSSVSGSIEISCDSNNNSSFTFGPFYWNTNSSKNIKIDLDETTIDGDIVINHNDSIESVTFVMNNSKINGTLIAKPKIKINLKKDEMSTISKQEGEIIVLTK
jgi:hypothetical protein